MGFGLNVIAAITLQLHNDGFPAVTKVLYQHQACLDALVCLMGFVIITQPCMGLIYGPDTKDSTIDLLLCQVWHSQAFFWTWVLISNWNIVYISLERFGMIHYPLRHRNTQVKYVCRGFCLIYGLSFFFLIPSCFQVMYDGKTGKCYDNYYYYTNEAFCGGMRFYGFFWFFISYALPIVIFITLYVLTVYNIRGRQRQQDNVNQKAVFKRANKNITRTAVAITICFVISQSPESWAYLIHKTYRDADNKPLRFYFKSSPIQTTFIFFACLNSVINPIIYCASLKVFRTSLRRTFRRGFLRRYIDPPTPLPSRRGTTVNENDDSRMIGSTSMQ